MLQSMGLQSWTRLATEQQQLVLAVTTKEKYPGIYKRIFNLRIFKNLKIRMFFSPYQNFCELVDHLLAVSYPRLSPLCLAAAAESS